MKIISYFNQRLELFKIWDIKLAQLAAMFMLIVLIKFIPQITTLNIWWYVAGCILTGIRPIYIMFMKKT